jgi:glucose-6-phosphate 1-dehydrogenase
VTVCDSDESVTVGDVLVLFGITGDLAKKMLLPALYRLAERGELNVPVIGVALADGGAEALRDHVDDCIRNAFGADDVDEAVLNRLRKQMHLVAGDFADLNTFERLAVSVREHAGAEVFAVHYLAVPPGQFATIANGLAAVGLHERARLVVEKPFGSDLASARELHTLLRRHFPEDRLFPVDHYLGKEPVEDLLVLRFANTLLEPLWNRHWIERIEIVMAEDFDVADRGAFYDEVGAVRDVVQNHLLQVVAYLLMEAPRSASAADQRDAKYSLLKAVRSVDPAEVVRGQYRGYRDILGVAADSITETFVAMTLHVDNWRWSGVPVRMSAGKALPKNALEIVAVLRPPPQALFTGPGHASPPPNRIHLRLQSDAGLEFALLAKQPGAGDVATEIPVSVSFGEVLGPVHAAYERILADALAGDPTHFARMDTLEEAWRIVGPILDMDIAPLPYDPGTWGPATADLDHGMRQEIQLMGNRQ